LLGVLLSLFENPETQLNTRIGISAIIEGLEGSEQLRSQGERLAAMLQHPDAGVRGDACHFLALTGLPQAKALITPLLEDPEQDVRMLATDSLAHLEEHGRH
jgi:hypothetical protein